MPSFDLIHLVKAVNVRLLESGDKQGEIVLRTIQPQDCAALLLLGNKTIVKVTYEYPDVDGPTQVPAQSSPSKSD